MESHAILSRTGRIDVSMHTRSKSEGAGFHGAVIQHLYQPENEILDRLRDVKEASHYLASILRDGAEILLLGAIP